MNDIINQIVKIDSLAFKNKNKNEEFLLRKKQGYESKISNYRSEKLGSAKIKAQNITEEAEVFIDEIKKSEKEKINKISDQVEKNYKKAEEKLIQEIFNKLFVLED